LDPVNTHTISHITRHTMCCAVCARACTYHLSLSRSPTCALTLEQLAQTRRFSSSSIQTKSRSGSPPPPPPPPPPLPHIAQTSSSAAMPTTFAVLTRPVSLRLRLQGWSVEHVCTQFLDKLGLSPLKQIFIDHKVTGHVLMVSVGAVWWLTPRCVVFRTPVQCMPLTELV
jgi:hypothetical protein